jgi:hypothetical protein
LYLLHRRLDEAVLAPYGWQNDLSKEEIVEKLLALNLARSKARAVLSVQGVLGVVGQPLKHSKRDF